MREFGSPPHSNRACEHVCGVLGPLSRKVSLGGRPLVCFSCRILLNLLHTPPHESCLPLIPLQIPSRAAAGRSLEPSGPEDGAKRGTPGCWDRGTSPWQFRVGAGG